MNKFRHVVFLGTLLSVPFFGYSAVAAPSWNGGVVQEDFTMNGGDLDVANIEVTTGNSLNINNNGSEVDDVTFTIIGNVSVEGDLLHNAGLAGAGSGSFSVLGDNTNVLAGGNIIVDGKIIAGGDKLTLGGASILADALDVQTTSELILNTDVISVDDASFAAGSMTVINSDFSGTPSLDAGTINIDGGLYMGDSATSGDVLQISSADSNNVYNIVSSTNFDVDGSINAEKGKIVINANTAQVSKDVLGSVDFDVNSLSLGGATLVAAVDWQDRLQHTDNGTGGHVGDLLADGTINSVGDIVIGGSVDGNLDITSLADMWVGDDLLGYWSIDVKKLYVLGSINGGGDISAETINVGGDLSGNINIDTNELIVHRDILGGTVFRPNMPTGPDGFHVNPDTGNTGPFKQIDMTVNGTYYFDNDSYLQLVLNSDTAASAGDSSYDPYEDKALISVGGFDASAVTVPPNYNDMDSTPNIEVLVDNMTDVIRKINLIEVTDPLGVIDLGLLDFIGVWFYWDDDSDGINDRRLFQESKLVVEGNNIFAVLATMNSIERITGNAVGANRNDLQMAAAIDDLVLARLKTYSGYTDDDLSNYYTSVMRILFQSDDVYYDLMLNGGNHHDAVDIMVSENPDYALNFVRGMGLDDVASIGSKLSLSSRVARNAVSD